MATATNRKRRINEYLEDNERWIEFRDKLKERGVSIRWAWSAKTSPSFKYQNIHCALFYGDGFQPSVLNAIVVDYCAGHPLGEQQGFGLFMDRGDNTITTDIEAICKPR